MPDILRCMGRNQLLFPWNFRRAFHMGCAYNPIYISDLHHVQGVIPHRARLLVIFPDIIPARSKIDALADMHGRRLEPTFDPCPFTANHVESASIADYFQLIPPLARMPLAAPHRYHFALDGARLGDVGHDDAADVLFRLFDAAD